jgi:hypothetical protein
VTTGNTAAQGIAAAVSPPRIEAQVNPGQTHRQIVEISHSGAKTGHYRVYTNDWSLQPDGGVVFTDKLVMGSCRPWVAIEKKELLIQPRGRHRYRFEIAVPPGAMAGECRFALMIEGVEPVTVDHGGIAMPVSGRMAVIVYASVGDAKPKMSVASHAVAEVQGQVLPVVEVRNDGNAHGRFDGALAAVDGEGNKLELVPSSFPILPGETRKVALAPTPVEGQAPAVLKFPLAVKGELEAGKDRLPLDLTFRR